MSALKKLTIVRHNLLGNSSNDTPGVVISEVNYSNGIETERLNYSSEGELEDHVIIEVENGLPVKETLKIEDEISEFVERVFDDKGRIVSETNTYQEGGSDITTYIYEGEKLIHKVTTDSDGEEGEKEIWEYSDNILIKETKVDLFGETVYEREYEYDEEGHIESMTEISYHNELPEKTVLIYDKEGRLNIEKRYDGMGKLVSRTIIEFDENGRPNHYEEENVRGKKITLLGYDDSGNNILQEERDQNDELLSSIKREFDNEGRQLQAEVVIQPSLYQPGHHYKLIYLYEFELS
jgi:hypothetical protein